MSEVEIERENAAIAQAYKDLLKISYRTLSSEDKKLIRKAFDTAVDAHKDQRRKSGEAYIFHPIAVAKIVASEIGLDATSIAAALLRQMSWQTFHQSTGCFLDPCCGSGTLVIIPCSISKASRTSTPS